MKDDAPAPADELDVLKVYVWVMLVMTVVLAVVVWIFWKKVDNLTYRVQQGRDYMEEMAEAKNEIKAMLNVYKDNREDEAREKPLTWFSAVWRRKGIRDQSIKPLSWRDPPLWNPKGKFYEEQITIQFVSKQPMKRKLIVDFCHEIERASTRLRIIELQLKRPKKDDFEQDNWYGSVVVGYRKLPTAE